jgi:hypothetical protein
MPDPVMETSDQQERVGKNRDSQQPLWNAGSVGQSVIAQPIFTLPPRAQA